MSGEFNIIFYMLLTGLASAIPGCLSVHFVQGRREPNLCPPVSVPFRGFLSRLACWASAQRPSLGAKIPRKLPAHRCFAVCAEQIWAKMRRRPQRILLYSQGLERSIGPNLPAQTSRDSTSFAQTQNLVVGRRPERKPLRPSEKNEKSAENAKVFLAFSDRLWYIK